MCNFLIFQSLRGLRDIDLEGSRSLKEIPNLSMATNLEKLRLCGCSSLVELPSSIQYLNKLETLDMSECIKLKTLPTGINLQSLLTLYLMECTQLKIFPQISTNIQWLALSGAGIEKVPSNLRLEKLVHVSMNTMKSKKLWARVQVPFSTFFLLTS